MKVPVKKKRQQQQQTLLFFKGPLKQKAPSRVAFWLLSWDISNMLPVFDI